ncbi:hypothetical protein CMV_018331 [Castanea mollissima]|uniref:Uncharacterized protein n=1 Tax=Castanea mollissima TaxID=60419 RepID=A0A8J4R3J4_9ROSI|nr:hypothetical protein CMV_018331 [Castanea mollissima]
MMDKAKEIEKRSFGMLVNSFYELELAYVDHYRNVIGRKAWHIGPVLLCNRNAEEKALRGTKSSIDEHECLKRLGSKKPNLVVLILEHESVGGFVTHCGWNSTLEGISAGLPMVIWPVFTKQFYNEKLVTDVLKIGVGVGAQQWIKLVGDYIKKEALEKAVKEVLVGEKAEERRGRAKALREMAKRAVEEGGSSYTDLGVLIGELRSYG